LLIPIIATDSRIFAGGVLGGTILLAVVIGFDSSIGYYMSLSRTFVFLPFFVSGYYIGHNVFGMRDVIESIVNKRLVKICTFVLMIVICMIVYKQNLNAGALYGSVSYIQGEFSWLIRGEMIAIAFAWIGIFMSLIPDRRIVGRIDTFPIYVLHGFFVIYLRQHNPFFYSFPANLLIAVLISIALICVLGNRYVSRVVKFLFRGEWVERIWDKFTSPRAA